MSEENLVFENNIRKMIADVKDAQYAQYLTRLIYQYEQKLVTKEYVILEINRTYPAYQQRYGRFVKPQAPTIIYVEQEPKKNIEFTVGAGVLGVVGAVFILIAFVMLGIAYMNGLIKGLMLYGIALVVLLLSELAVSRKMPRFSAVLTGIGMGGLFLSTIINMTYLHNFGPWIGTVVSIVIFVLAILIGRKKESDSLHIISYIGCYVCVFPIWLAICSEWDRAWSFENLTNVFWELNIYFVIIVAIISCINLLTIFLPAKRYHCATYILLQCASLLFTVAFAGMALISDIAIDLIMIFIAFSVLIQGVQLKSYLHIVKKQDRGGEQLGETSTYIVANVLLSALFVLIGLNIEYNLWMHVAVFIFIAVEAVQFVMFKKSWLKWVACESACFAVFVLYNLLAGRTDYSYAVAVGVTVVIFLFVKIGARRKLLRVSDVVCTILTALVTLISFLQDNLIYAVCFLAAYIAGMFIEKNYKSLYEEIVLLLLSGFILINFRNELTVAILTCIFFVGTVVCNYVPYLKDTGIRIINYINLMWMAIIYMVAPFYTYGIPMLILCLLGCAYMLFTFNDKYGMNFKIKNIIFVAFLCYMVLVWELPVRVLKSILLMVIAIGAVVFGFVNKEKKLRISGLVLSLAVCGKLLLYDFPGAATLEKTILFFTAGVIVLAISGVYIALEKKMM